MANKRNHFTLPEQYDQVVIPEEFDVQSAANSWFGVYLALFFFFPLGIWLSLSRLHREKDRYLPNGKRVSVIGWVFFAIGAVYYGLFQSMAAEGYTDLDAGINFFGWMAIGGLALVFHGRKYKKIGENQLLYYPILLNSKDGSLDAIAATVGKDYDTVCKDIQQLIDKDLLADGIIHHDGRQLVCHALGIGIASAFAGKEKPAMSRKAMIEKEVKCPNCGGITNVQGLEDCPCDYCGTMLRVR